MAFLRQVAGDRYPLLFFFFLHTIESQKSVVLTPVSPQRNDAATYPHPTHFGDTFRSVLLTFIALACVAGIVIAAAVVFCLRLHAKQREKERLAGLGPEGAADSTFEYQVSARAKGWDTYNLL